MTSRLSQPPRSRPLVAAAPLALWVALTAALAGCGADSTGGDPTPEVRVGDPAAPGPYDVGLRTYALTYKGRTLQVDAYYPTTQAPESPLPLADLCTSTAERDTLAGLVKAAPPGCVSAGADLTRDAPLAPGQGPWPVLLFSHCHNCTRWSSVNILRRLASHGFVVLAPDHTTNTLFDQLAGASAALGKAFLDVRVADLTAVLDDALAAAPTALPVPLHGAADPARVGALGHSFGSVTAGLFTQQDPRVKAVAGIAAPMANPLLPGVDMAKITEPLLLLVALEDNSITVAGNLFLNNNFKDAGGPAWKLDIADAGHWSFSDIAGLTEGLMPGCGDAERMTNGDPFTYLPVTDAQRVAQRWIGAFFLAHLGTEDAIPQAAAVLASPPVDARVTVTRKP